MWCKNKRAQRSTSSLSSRDDSPVGINRILYVYFAQRSLEHQQCNEINFERLCSRQTMWKSSVLLICWIFFFSATDGAHRYFWRDYMGTIPEDAFVGAPGIYIGQGVLDGLIPGSFYPSSREVVTERHTGRLTFKTGIKLLCDSHHNNFEWEFVNVDGLRGDKLKDLVVGGFEMGSTLYIGKTFHEGQWKIGKVFPPTSEYKGLRVWNMHGKVHALDDFQILKYVEKP